MRFRPRLGSVMPARGVNSAAESVVETAIIRRLAAGSEGIGADRSPTKGSSAFSAAMPCQRHKTIAFVASMTDPRNAAELRRLILAKGLGPLEIEPGEGPQGPVHRVILGPYATEEEARAAADSVATLGDLNPRVREAPSP